MTVDVLGATEREAACGDILASRGSALDFSRAIVLPIPTTRNGREITGCEMPLADLIPLAGEGTLFCAYALPASVSSEIVARGAVLADIAEDAVFAERNAELTAECVLSYIMSTEKRALSDMRIGIIGYGKIGTALLEMLLFHGADVTVFTRKNSTRMALIELGASAELVSDAHLCDLDAVVNTAPARLLCRAQYGDFDGRILELAPGDNFPWAKNLKRLPSLPAKMLPQSSGRLYADAVCRILGKEVM